MKNTVAVYNFLVSKFFSLLFFLTEKKILKFQSRVKNSKFAPYAFDFIHFSDDLLPKLFLNWNTITNYQFQFPYVNAYQIISNANDLN